jgi:SAM-dependent methyltransferase
MWHPLSRIARKYAQYLPRKLSRFRFNGHALPYLCRFYNQTWMNERCIEVPLAMQFVEPGQSILEVGRVLDHYHTFPHDCVDKFEKGALNIDILDFKSDTRYDAIVTISTLEHVGWDVAYGEARDPSKLHAAIRILLAHLKPGGKLVATLPLGYNENLDADLAKGARLFDEQYYFVQKPFGWWEQVSAAVARPYLFRDGIAQSLMLGVSSGR